jgi:predicted amidophosphoribosyltransferase
MLASGSRLLEELLGIQRPTGAALRSILHEATTEACRSSMGSIDVPEAGSASRSERAPDGIDSMTTLGRYDGVLADLLATAKYRAWPEPLEHFGNRLGQELQATADWLPDSLTGVSGLLLVPVPSPRLRRWNRGLDHTAILADGVSNVINVPVRSLVTRSWVPPQMGLGRRSRSEVGGSLQLRRRASRWLERRPVVILVDDVMTTGATLSAMAKVLRRGGAHQVHACVVAHGRAAGQSPTPGVFGQVSWGISRG